ncbi:class I SAM-dependent methyltransferase family protein [Candidatus Woesearchaeota archaeon]|nr:class I SAM-dependent methyltransferase family protein [Candidatus Woesearchaeota archaeon]
MEKKLKELLKKKLTKKQMGLLPSSYDVVGSVIVFSGFPFELLKKEKLIGEALLELHKNIKTVCKKTKKYSGKYRLPKLQIIAGEKTKETLYKENNVSLKLDVEKVYFSSRLSSERKRIYQMVKPKEDVLVMFSGCGVYPIVISKNTLANEVYGIEINPLAHKYATENIKLNKVNNVKLFKGDVNLELPKINKKFSRILMPLPKGAEVFLGLALSKIKKKGVVHFYDFLSEDYFDLAKKKIAFACEKAGKKFKILKVVKCGQFSPRVYRLCVDFMVL